MSDLMYEGILLYGDGDDVSLPFTIKFFKDKSMKITRTDGRPFDEVYYPDFTFYTEVNKSVDNKDKKVISISLKDKGDHYTISFFDGELEVTSVIHCNEESYEELPQWVDIDTCHLCPNDGHFYLVGKTVLDVVDANKMLEDMFSYYDFRDVDAPDQMELENVISEVFLKDGLEKAKDFDFIMQEIFSPKELVKMEPVVRKYIEMDDFE